MGFRTFSVSHKALAQARELGLDGDHAQSLTEMARLSAPFTHEAGNCRFKGWWLRIENGEIAAVGKIGSTTPRADRRTEEQKREARLRVKQAIALHFRRP